MGSNDGVGVNPIKPIDLIYKPVTDPVATISFSMNLADDRSSLTVGGRDPVIIRTYKIVKYNKGQSGNSGAGINLKPIVSTYHASDYIKWQSKVTIQLIDIGDNCCTKTLTEFSKIKDKNNKNGWKKSPIKPGGITPPIKPQPNP